MPNAFESICNRPGRLRRPKAGGVANKQPHQVLRRNERERRRVEQVNLGFVHLRDHVPHSLTNKKLSKVDTLREAARYIRHLQDMLDGTCDRPFQPISDQDQRYSSTPNTPQSCTTSPQYYQHPLGDGNFGAVPGNLITQVPMMSTNTSSAAQFTKFHCTGWPVYSSGFGSVFNGGESCNENAQNIEQRHFVGLT